jgi:hypothetical protein
MDNKLGLNDREYAYFTAQIIAGGDLHLMKIDKEKALKLFQAFIDAFVPNNIEPEVFVNSIYNIVQNSMLASRGYSFESLQLIPAFSDFGKKNFLQLLKFYKEKGIEAFENGFKRMFREGWQQKKPPPEIIRILSGDGRTIENPVKFSTEDVARRIRAEYWFITYNYGKENEGWERGVHYSTIQPQTHKMISNWSITLSDGKNVSVYFNTNKD